MPQVWEMCREHLNGSSAAGPGWEVRMCEQCHVPGDTGSHSGDRGLLSSSLVSAALPGVGCSHGQGGVGIWGSVRAGWSWEEMQSTGQ